MWCIVRCRSGYCSAAQARKGSLQGRDGLGLAGCGDWLLLGRCREVAGLDAGCLSLGLADHVLCLLCVLAGVALEGLRRAAGVLSSHVADLAGLGGGDLLRVLEVFVNQGLVLDVDKWAEEEEDVEDESEAPEWEPLNQPVGDEGGKEGLAHVSFDKRLVDRVFTYQHRSPDVLSEQNTLELNDEEVDELLCIVQGALERLFGDDEVLLRPHLGCDAFA
jgi:hypothetical protein